MRKLEYVALSSVLNSHSLIKATIDIREQEVRVTQTGHICIFQSEVLSIPGKIMSLVNVADTLDAYFEKIPIMYVVVVEMLTMSIPQHLVVTLT